MSKTKIKIGSRVVVCYSEWASEGAAIFYGELVGRPQDVGDTFKIIMEPCGTLTEINPCASSFESITEAPLEATT